MTATGLQAGACYAYVLYLYHISRVCTTNTVSINGAPPAGLIEDSDPSPNTGTALATVGGEIVFAFTRDAGCGHIQVSGLEVAVAHHCQHG